MGMFDTFICKNGVECQTKELDCVLDVYNLGDYVPDNGNMSNYYLIAGHGNDKHGIIVIDNIYLVYCEPDIVESTFKNYYNNSEMTAKTLSEIIKDKNIKLYQAQHKLYQLSSAVREYDDFKNKNLSEHEQNMSRILSRGYFEKFERGTDIIDIIKDILKQDIKEIKE